MCGIAGAWEFKGRLDEGALERMGDSMSHRGPDDKGLYVDPKGNIGLYHRRLSIIDLSAGGHQPMTRGNLTLTYNGEIYNFKEVRKELEALGVTCTSESDSEVLLLAFKQWGERSVDKFRGMFAFAIWNEGERTLTLCRDRAGVKPLYYYSDGSRFLFASEINALARHPKVVKELHNEAAALFLWLGFIPAPHSIFKSVYKLEPGHFLKVNEGGAVTKSRYWDIAKPAHALHTGDEARILGEVEDTLTEAFKLRMVSDVPVGVFLSGGIDSSIVAALLMKEAPRPLMTFTVGFEEDGYNEAHFAKEVARHLGTEHKEIYLSYKKAVDIVERLPEMFGEPYGGASAIPTFLVSEFARENVTVALSADGGDELFCGYGDRYPAMASTFSKYAPLSPLAPLARLLHGPLSGVVGGSRAELLGAAGNPAATYATIGKRIFTYGEVAALMRGRVGENFADTYWEPFRGLKDLEPATQFALFDFKTAFADNILTKVDRASMAVSLESREPFLDPKVMELAASLPTALKYKNGESKYLLKQILYKYIPQELVDRPKHGFSMPVRALLEASSVDYLSEYLSDEKVARNGLLDPELVRKEKEKFRAGGKSKTAPRRIWRLLMLAMWQERWGL